MIHLQVSLLHDVDFQCTRKTSVDQASDRRRAVPNLIEESSMATLNQLTNAKAIAIAKLARPKTVQIKAIE